MSVTSVIDSTLFQSSVDRDKRITLFAIGGQVLVGIYKGGDLTVTVQLTADEAREIAQSFSLAAAEADEITANKIAAEQNAPVCFIARNGNAPDAVYYIYPVDFGPAIASTGCSRWDDACDAAYDWAAATGYRFDASR